MAGVVSGSDPAIGAGPGVMTAREWREAEAELTDAGDRGGTPE